MTLEADLVTLVKALCPRVFPDVADVSTDRPYVTYQGIGGRSLRWLALSPADKRHTIMQVNVWADTRASASALARQIEDALCAASAFTAWPQAEPISTYDADMKRYGTIQDFEIYSTR